MAAGPGADVGDAALLLFAQTAAERADTQPRQQVCLKTPHWQKGLLFSLQHFTQTPLLRFCMCCIVFVTETFIPLVPLSLRTRIRFPSSGSRK